MAYNVAIKPLGLGLLAPVGAGVADYVQATSNLNTGLSNGAKASGNTNSADDLWVNKIEFKAYSGNSGRVFICSYAVAVAGTLNITTTFFGVIRALDSGESWSITNPVGMNCYHPGDYCVVIETAGDTCHGECDTV